MNLSYFQAINNLYNSDSKQETELFLMNRYENRHLYDNVDAHKVLKNNEPFELLIIKSDSETKKKIKSKNDAPYNLGDYINWNGKIYIVTSLDPDDKTHHSGVMTLCMYILRWQKNNGDIIERWASVTDFTKYDSGQTSNGVITVTSNQYGLTVPIDEETRILPRDKRFVIDIVNQEDVNNGIIPDTYLLSNEKKILNDYTYFGRGGTITFTLKIDSFDKNRDKWVDGYGWICDYIEPQSNPSPDAPSFSNVSANIIGSDSIYVESNRTWKVEFRDSDNQVLPNNTIPFTWNVSWNFVNIVTQTESKIQLNVDKSHLGKEFELQIKINNDVIASKKIEIRM